MSKPTITISNSNIIITKNASSLTLTLSEFDDIVKEVNTLTYYRQDVIRHICTNLRDEYDCHAIVADTQLIKDITSTYSDYRYRNNGGEGDCTLDWMECLDIAITAHMPQLAKYML